ncbi:hypothetical protein CRG98_040145, partial [Punica granatum]
MDEDHDEALEHEVYGGEIPDEGEEEEGEIEAEAVDGDGDYYEDPASAGAPTTSSSSK